jgi:hypothetical protein
MGPLYTRGNDSSRGMNLEEEGEGGLVDSSSQIGRYILILYGLALCVGHNLALYLSMSSVFYLHFTVKAFTKKGKLIFAYIIFITNSVY